MANKVDTNEDSLAETKSATREIRSKSYEETGGQESACGRIESRSILAFFGGAGSLCLEEGDGDGDEEGVVERHLRKNE